MFFFCKSYRLILDVEKFRVIGIVQEKLLNDYLNCIFFFFDYVFLVVISRKFLNFQNLLEYLDQLLQVDNEEEESQGQVEGWFGLFIVVLDYIGGFEGFFLVDDDLLGVIGYSNFGIICFIICVYKGKWVYEVFIFFQGFMQIGWCIISCCFNQEEGVGDIYNFYVYDGNCVCKWNVIMMNYGKVWVVGDIVSCLIDLDDGILFFCLNGVLLGIVFENLFRGLGMVYFLVISFFFKEFVVFNFGSCFLCYLVVGYWFLQDLLSVDLVWVQRLLGCFWVVLSVELDFVEGWLLDKESFKWWLWGQFIVFFILVYIFYCFVLFLCKVYLVEVVFMSFLLGIVEKGIFVQVQFVVYQVLDFLWFFMEDYEV